MAELLPVEDILGLNCWLNEITRDLSYLESMSNDPLPFGEENYLENDSF